MIQALENLPAGTVGFRCGGQLSGEEMQRVVAPAIRAAISEYDRIKALLRVEPDFEGFSLAAAWDDAALGLRYWDGFERLAVVTDHAWLGQGLSALAVLLPCPLRRFPLAEEAMARRWLSEALGTIHLDQQGEVITITLIGQLDPESYARVDDDLAGLFSAVAEPRVLLDLRQFEGWLGLGALRQHLALIREYRHQPRRLALVCGTAWQPLARRLLPAFSGAEARCFASSDLLTAQEWICAD